MIDIFLDIETIPSQCAEFAQSVRAGIKPPGNIKKPESIAAWMAENADAAIAEQIAKTSLDPAHGHICCLSMATENDDTVYWEARSIEDERNILECFFEALPKMNLPRLIGHHVVGFDHRFILCRAIVLGVKIPQSFPRDMKPWDDRCFDTMLAWAGARGTIGLDRLCKALGIDGKGDFSGSMVADAWKNGDYATIARYCMDDVERVRSVYRKFEAVGF